MRSSTQGQWSARSWPPPYRRATSALSAPRRGRIRGGCRARRATDPPEADDRQQERDVAVAGAEVRPHGLLREGRLVHDAPGADDEHPDELDAERNGGEAHRCPVAASEADG